MRGREITLHKLDENAQTGMQKFSLVRMGPIAYLNCTEWTARKIAKAVNESTDTLTLEEVMDCVQPDSPLRT